MSRAPQALDERHAPPSGDGLAAMLAPTALSLDATQGKFAGGGSNPAREDHAEQHGHVVQHRAADDMAMPDRAAEFQFVD